MIRLFIFEIWCLTFQLVPTLLELASCHYRKYDKHSFTDHYERFSGSSLMPYYMTMHRSHLELKMLETGDMP